MEPKREQAIVGVFVLIASALLLAVVFMLTGALGKAGANSYTATFKFAGGLEPGATVRYAGGPKVGRVEKLQVDPADDSQIEITFTVRSDVPVKTDSVVKIAALSALGENYLEITAGKPDSPEAPSDTKLQSKPYFGISDLSDLLSEVGPKAASLLDELKARATELKETVNRLNDVINEQNRMNISKSLGEVRGMLEENRPKVRSTLGNIDKASAKFEPLLEDFKKTVADADKAINSIDATLTENRPDVRAAVTEMKRTLASASELVDQLNRTIYYNSENIDEMLENMRLTTQNLKQFTDQIRTRPSSLIRSSGPQERKPGDPPKQK